MYNVSVCLSLVEDVSFSGPVRDARHPWHQSNPDEWGQDARHPYNTIKQVWVLPGTLMGSEVNERSLLLNNLFEGPQHNPYLSCKALVSLPWA